MVDAMINFLLGTFLLFFPRKMMTILGIPIPDKAFYASILGAILVGIGISLVIECKRKNDQIVGLGIGGAVAINICGASALIYWLLAGQLGIPTHGYAILWGIALAVLSVSFLELKNIIR